MLTSIVVALNAVYEKDTLILTGVVVVQTCTVRYMITLEHLHTLPIL